MCGVRVSEEGEGEEKPYRLHLHKTKWREEVEYGRGAIQMTSSKWNRKEYSSQSLQNILTNPNLSCQIQSEMRNFFKKKRTRTFHEELAIISKCMTQFWQYLHHSCVHSFDPSDHCPIHSDSPHGFRITTNRFPLHSTARRTE